MQTRTKVDCNWANTQSDAGTWRWAGRDHRTCAQIPADWQTCSLEGNHTLVVGNHNKTEHQHDKGPGEADSVEQWSGSSPSVRWFPSARRSPHDRVTKKRSRSWVSMSLWQVSFLVIIKLSRWPETRRQVSGKQMWFYANVCCGERISMIERAERGHWPGQS